MRFVPPARFMLAVESTSWSPAAAWSLAGGAWLSLMVYCIAVGWPQTKDANGTLSRLLWVSSYLGALGALPAMIIAFFAFRGPISWEQWYIVSVSTLLNLVGITWALLPVVLRSTRQKLPDVTDERLLSRMESLAERMKVSTPLVRLWPPITGSKMVTAFAGTLQAPQLVVIDGTIHRLESDECDFILAHELAHIANGSLFILAAIIPIGCAVTTAVTFVLPLSIAIPFGFVFTGGLRRLVGRSVEFDCDHRAAKVTGFRIASSCADKTSCRSYVSEFGNLVTSALCNLNSFLARRTSGCSNCGGTIERPPAFGSRRCRDSSASLGCYCRDIDLVNCDAGHDSDVSLGANRMVVGDSANNCRIDPVCSDKNLDAEAETN